MRIIRVLTIGNSFADNALAFLDDLARSSGCVRFEIGRANLGGCSLEKHWNLAVYTERCPAYKTYRLGSFDGVDDTASLQDALGARAWDYVTLQQVSHKSWRQETYQPHLGLLVDRVRMRVPGAGILLHQTWAYRADSPFLLLNGLTQERMFTRIRNAYAHYAAELGCGILPSGAAVQRARREPGRAFTWPDPDFDYQQAEAPALPAQLHSLAVGWHWVINHTAEGIPELHLDANHLNPSGCYLAGCVWFERLTGLDARSLSFVPDGMNRETAAFLRATAHETVSDI